MENFRFEGTSLTLKDVRAAAFRLLGLAILAALAAGCADSDPDTATDAYSDSDNVTKVDSGSAAGAQVICSDAWYRSVEEVVPTGDGQGHGPDAGSDEWKSVVEFKLGIRGEPEVPARDTDDWCRYIDQLVPSGELAAAPR